MAVNRRGGVLSISANGTLLEVVGAWTFKPGIEVREAIPGPNGPVGYKGNRAAPSWEGRASYNPNLDIEALQNLDDATVVGVLPNGRVATLRNAWFAGEGDLTTEDGTFAVKFEGLGYSLD
jgi:hypothetical protein